MTLLEIVKPLLRIDAETSSAEFYGNPSETGGVLRSTLRDLRVIDVRRFQVPGSLARLRCLGPSLRTAMSTAGSDGAGPTPYPVPLSLRRALARHGYLWRDNAGVTSRKLARHLENLPFVRTTMIGREDEIADIKRSLAAWRMVTLTGTGGVGKTRLALRVAADLEPHFKDGVRWVDFAPLVDASLLPDAVAQVFGLRPRTSQAVSKLLVEYLRRRSILLILDNCEHMVRACAQLVDDLLRGCPGLRVLTTSREPLSLIGEAVHVVPSLSMPSRNDLDCVLQSESARLFADRATAALPGFRVTSENAGEVARICRRLDGVPLAIELASARVAMFSVEQIALGLDDRFRLLTAGNAAGIPRQRTLRATVDWSHDLLSDAERMLFRRLAIFPGSWTLDAVKAVCTDQKLESSDALDLLTQLTAKSLVLVEHRSPIARYRLLETVRQYATERLAEAGESAVLADRHARFFRTLGEEAERHLWGPEQASSLERLESDHDNLRGALAWYLTADPDQALRLAVALWRFWDVRGFLTEGTRWLDAVLSGAPAATATRAEALLGLAFLYRDRGDERHAGLLAEEALGIFRRIDDEHWTGRTLGFLGGVTRARDLERSASLLEEGLAILEKVGDELHAAYSLLNLAITVEQAGDRTRARALLEDSLSRFRRLGDRTGMAWVLGDLGGLELLRGDDRRAETLLRESLARGQEIGDRRVVTWAQRRLGDVELHRGRWENAAARWREALALARDIDDAMEIAEGLVRFGVFAKRLGNDDRAVRFLGAAETLLGEQGGVDGATRSMPPELVGAMGPHLRFATLESARDARSDGSLGQIIDDALAVEERQSGAQARSRSKPHKMALTERELEVAALVSRGLTNRQIAERLVLSERTIDAHLERIRNRLGVRSRVEIAAWLLERSLVAGLPRE
jgi:predicted ATPase/DNA-binding CsgD family transcriptional regulator